MLFLLSNSNAHKELTENVKFGVAIREKLSVCANLLCTAFILLLKYCNELHVLRDTYLSG